MLRTFEKMSRRQIRKYHATKFKFKYPYHNLLFDAPVEDVVEEAREVHTSTEIHGTPNIANNLPENHETPCELILLTKFLKAIKMSYSMHLNSVFN